MTLKNDTLNKMNNREEINRLKEEYKEHYRAMQETAKKAYGARRKANIVSALKAMDTTELFSSMESAMDSLREKLTRAEARLEVFFESQVGSDDISEDISEFEAKQKKEQARKTVEHIRRITERYESELDEVLKDIDIRKTLGNSSKE